MPAKALPSPAFCNPRGKPMLISCRSGTFLARKVISLLNKNFFGSTEDCFSLIPDIEFSFSDGESNVTLDKHVAGHDCFLFQCLFDPLSKRSINENYSVFLIAARALKENGANHITGVLPYLAYARQDKATKFKREPTTARLFADLSIKAGVDRLIAWEPHSDQIRGFYGNTPVTMLESLSLYLKVFNRFKNRDDVIVIAPDVGASKYVTHFSKALGLRSAIAAKFRENPEEVTINELIGDFSGIKTAIILDDLISSGETIYQLIKKLARDMRFEEIHLGISHGLFVKDSLSLLKDLSENYNLKSLIITNSINQPHSIKKLPFIRIECLSEYLSAAIERIHNDLSVSEIFYTPGKIV